MIEREDDLVVSVEPRNDGGASAKADRAVVNGANELSPPLRASVPSAALLDEITAHLGAAIMQSVSTDDQIIMEHVRAAHGLATILRKAQR